MRNARIVVQALLRQFTLGVPPFLFSEPNERKPEPELHLGIRGMGFRALGIGKNRAIHGLGCLVFAKLVEDEGLPSFCPPALGIECERPFARTSCLEPALGAKRSQLKS